MGWDDWGWGWYLLSLFIKCVTLPLAFYISIQLRGREGGGLTRQGNGCLSPTNTHYIFCAEQTMRPSRFILRRKGRVEKHA